MLTLLYAMLLQCPFVPRVDDSDDAVKVVKEDGDDKCSDASVVTYYKKKAQPAMSDPRCTVEQGKCVQIELKGYLYLPTSNACKGPHPVIIYNHGSGKPVGENRRFGSYFADLGYVVFIPHRRGHGCSTGPHFGQECAGKKDGGACKMKHLRAQVEDVKEAIDFVKERSDVDPKRIAIVGHSFGGIVSMFANERKLGQKAVVNFAGGSQSWEQSEVTVAELMKSARNAVSPVYYFAPLNDASIEPTLRLAYEAGTHCRQFQSALFPAVDVTGDDEITKADYDGTKDENDKHARDDAHGKSTRMVRRWGPSVDEFLRRNFEHPAKFDELCVGTSLSATTRIVPKQQSKPIAATTK